MFGFDLHIFQFWYMTSCRNPPYSFCLAIQFFLLFEKIPANTIPREGKTRPVSGFLWKATACNKNQARKGIDTFEWEGDYLAEAANRLRELLEERV
jgi:hypothetical protein